MSFHEPIQRCAGDFLDTSATPPNVLSLGGRSADAGPSIVIPSFFVLGPPRTGTSWLHEVLSPHTNLPSPTKETRFFDVHFDRGLDWYAARFPEVRNDRPTGEVAPTYFASPEARHRISQMAPQAKLIIIFRHPVQRVVSLYRVKRAYGMLSWSLEEALQRDPELLESGKYASQLKEWQSKFPEDQILVTFYDDLRTSPQKFLDKITEFIGIPPIEVGDDALRQVHSSERLTQPRNYLLTRGALGFADWCKAHNLDNVVSAVRNSRLMKMFIGSGPEFQQLSSTAKARISAAFIPEVENLERLMGRDLSHWKTAK